MFKYGIYVALRCFFIFFFKQKTAYEMRISDWSSDVCSSDLQARHGGRHRPVRGVPDDRGRRRRTDAVRDRAPRGRREDTARGRRLAGLVRAPEPVSTHGPGAVRLRATATLETDYLRHPATTLPRLTLLRRTHGRPAGSLPRTSAQPPW